MDTEDRFTARLSDYLDGEDLSAGERAAIDAHLATCSSCRTTLAELREVAALGASLSDRAPVADLWSGVAARLTPDSAVLPFVSPLRRRFSFTLPQLVAASLALMVLSGGLVWVARLDDPRASLPPVVAEVEPRRSFSPTSTTIKPSPIWRRFSHRAAAGSMPRRYESSRRICAPSIRRSNSRATRCARIPTACISTTTSPHRETASSRCSAARARWRWRRIPSEAASVPDPTFVTKFLGGASRLASLLLAHIYGICSLVAPRDPGAAPGTLATNVGSGTLVR